MSCRRATWAGTLAALLPLMALSPARARAQEPAPVTTPAAPGATPANRCADGEAEMECLRRRLAALESARDDQRREAAPEIPLEAAQLDLEPQTPALQIYGFLDTGFNYTIDRGTPLTGFLSSRGGSFVSGNTNLYFDARPHENWRALIETRLTFAPHGNEYFDERSNFQRVNTRVIDSGSPSGRNEIVWSGVVTERAQVEWRHYDELQVIAGYFLTPFGIWNVDHGTPTLISLALPALQVEEAIPQHQTGIQVLGTFNFAPWDLGYRAYVTNGRVAGVLDLSADKAVGGRLYLRRDDESSLTLGMSAYRGSSQDVTKTLSFPGGEFGIESTTVYDYSEWAVGLDLAVDLGPLRLRSEVLLRHVQYEDGLHEPAQGPPGATLPNRYGHYAYAIAAYRLWDRFEPYLLVDGKRYSPRSGFSDYSVTYGPGLNIYMTPMVQLRFQYDAVTFGNSSGPGASGRNFQFFGSRLVISF